MSRRLTCEQFAYRAAMVRASLWESEGAAVMAYRRARQRIRSASIEITQPTPFGFGGRADLISDKQAGKRQASAEFRQRSGE